MVRPINAFLGAAGLYITAGTVNSAALIYKNHKISSTESRINACTRVVGHSDYWGIITCRSVLASNLPHNRSFRAKPGVYCGQCMHDREALTTLRKESDKLTSFSRFFWPFKIY